MTLQHAIDNRRGALDQAFAKIELNHRLTHVGVQKRLVNAFGHDAERLFLTHGEGSEQGNAHREIFARRQA
jgi:hypothetical protein